MQDSASQEKPGAVGRGVVGEAHLEPIARKLVGVGGGENQIADDAGGDDLGDDVLVGESDDEPVLGCVVFVLVLVDEADSGSVIGLSLSSSLVLNLEALEVGPGFQRFHEGHG